jgi:phosphocarrier protein HPr
MAVSRVVEILNVRGLHARASRKMAELALTFQSRIVVRKDEDEADATSLMDLMMLGAGIGSFIEIVADGADADAALEAMAALIADRFGEGE